MERLLADAEKISGVKYDISSYADVVEAIHVMQESMDIAGTTAKEAATTIQGSVGAMKAAWENFLTGLGDKEADLGDLTDKLVDSAMTAADNIVPVVSRILKGFSKTISEKAPKIVSTLSDFITENAEPMAEAATQLVLALVDGIAKNAGTLAKGAVKIIKMLVDGLVKALPQILQAAIEIVTTLADALADDPDTLVETAITLIETLVTGLLNAIPKLIQAAGKLIAGLVRGLVSNGPNILKTGLKLVGELYKGLWEAHKSMWKVGWELIKQLWEGIKGAWENLKKWVKDAWNSLFGGMSADVEINGEVKKNGKTGSKTTVQGSFAKGLDYVPYDGYIAELHRGETVLTAKQAARYRSGASGSTDELLTAILNKLDGMGVYIDGNTLTGYVDGSLGKRTKQANRLKMA